jgi:hypothetical protein
MLSVKERVIFLDTRPCPHGVRILFRWIVGIILAGC